MQKPWIWLRIASASILFVALGHTFGHFTWKSRGTAESLVFAAMRNYQFDVAGVTRSHWIFYRGYSLYLTITFVMIGLITWQLARLSRTQRREIAGIVAVLFVGGIGLAALAWASFFAAPAIPCTLFAVATGIAWAGCRG